LLLLLLALMGLVRTFFGGVAVHWSGYKRRCFYVWRCVPVRASVEEWRVNCKV
jgi:hypothetical protein